LVSVMDEATDARTRRCYPLLYARYSFLQRKGAKRRPRGYESTPILQIPNAYAARMIGGKDNEMHEYILPFSLRCGIIHNKIFSVRGSQ